jgi:hypothetical protein
MSDLIGLALLLFAFACLAAGLTVIGMACWKVARACWRGTGSYQEARTRWLAKR